jgi:hypothetical protein
VLKHAHGGRFPDCAEWKSGIGNYRVFKCAHSVSLAPASIPFVQIAERERIRKTPHETQRFTDDAYADDPAGRIMIHASSFDPPAPLAQADGCAAAQRLLGIAVGGLSRTYCDGDFFFEGRSSPKERGLAKRRCANFSWFCAGLRPRQENPLGVTEEVFMSFVSR